ncbi:MAG TPA: GNAT family N-acetyltransferase [Pyrinomonadaceae bacterium]|jgi:GNAT superfamily N-acetyltransferase
MNNSQNGFEITSYQDRYRADFERLNREWIEKFFTLEDSDKKMFADPAGKIIVPGGQIFFIIENNRVQGTCAMMPENGTEIYELTKMAVDASARGKGFGDRLMQKAIAFAKEKGAREIVLYSNKKLEAAINLYKKYGFEFVPCAFDDRYQRADVMMRLILE